MAITYESVAGGTNSSGAGSLSWNHSIPAAVHNNCVIVDFTVKRQSGTTDPTSITATIGGNAMTLLSQRLTNNLDPDTARFIYVGIGSGVNSIVVTWTGMTGLGGGESTLFGGVDQITPYLAGSNTYATGNSASSSLSVAARAGGLVVGFNYHNSSATWSPAGGITATYSRALVGGDPIMQGGYKAGADPNVSISWSGTATVWHLHGVCLMPAGGGSKVLAVL